MARKQVIDMKIGKVNDMPEKDYKRLLNIICNNDGTMNNKYESGHYEKHGMRILGSGAFGSCYEFIGEDGYAYAVKVGDYPLKTHDGQVLEQIQGIKGINKLFFYLSVITMDREIYHSSNGKAHQNTEETFIMVSKRINGTTIEKMLEPENSQDKINAERWHCECPLEAHEEFDKLYREVVARGLMPRDTHLQNVMYDFDTRSFVIIDYGNFEPIEIYKSEEAITGRIEEEQLRTRIGKLYRQYANREVLIA